MKAAPTLDGRIRIDVEDALDLAVLRAVVADAHSRDDDLASRLAAGTDPARHSSTRRGSSASLSTFHAMVASTSSHTSTM